MEKTEMKNLCAVGLSLICLLALASPVLSQGSPMTLTPPVVTNHYGVKVQVAQSPQNWPDPIRWLTHVSATSLTSTIERKSCSLVVLPYYPYPFANGPVEFPGDFTVETSLASWCYWDATPGACTKLDLKEYATPDLLGHVLVVTDRASC